jgi:hypothetical protein
MDHTAKQEAHAHHQQKVRENRAEHRSLDNVDLLFLERNNADLRI